MPAYGSALRPEELVALVDFLVALDGARVAGPSH
jgi:hypothetical protein